MHVIHFSVARFNNIINFWAIEGEAFQLGRWAGGTVDTDFWPVSIDMTPHLEGPSIRSIRKLSRWIT